MVRTFATKTHPNRKRKRLSAKSDLTDKAQMIKFRAEYPSKAAIIGLGLSKENCQRLMADQIIIVNLRELGIDTDVEVILFGGKTEDEMKTRLSKYVTLPPSNI